VTQTELAGTANLSRNSVGAILQRLKARGLVEQGYRGMTLRAPAALRAFVDQG
jgi:Mn-dependent DtxR family transcriptional regulator